MASAICYPSRVPKQTTLQQVPQIAESFPEVTRGVACKGTKLESTTFGVKNKVFLFVRDQSDPVELRFKLAASASEAQKLSATDKRVSIGANNWAKLSFSPTDPPALDLVQRWIGESYTAVVGTSPVGTASGKAQATKAKPAPTSKPAAKTTKKPTRKHAKTSASRRA